MDALYAHIPTDRRHALAAGVDLPERTTGAALFADISGFTPLTESLVRALGPQRGAEELGRQLNQIYDALIDQVDRFSGSVLSFSGDAITCWFDDDPHLSHPREGSIVESATARATAAAFAMQQAMQQFASMVIGAGTVAMAIKIAVTAGSVRRFTVGDPSIQLSDALAGATINRLAAGEHLANKGEIVLDAAAAAVVGNAITIAEWRIDPESGLPFAVADSLQRSIAPLPWPALTATQITEAIVRSWVLPPVFERLQGGQGDFLTELRPAVALFLRFGGLDYDHDDATQVKLDQFIRRVQQIIAHYGGYMVQLTIGDKGSYLYAAFGALRAYEDDAIRAIAAALELREIRMAQIDSIQIGISQGRMRVGAYGGESRRTYGVLGDEVNMSARLMQHAPPGEALVSLMARKASGDVFVWDALPPLQVKGKSEPVSVFRLIGRQERRAIRLHEPQYARPMVGRSSELAQIEQRIGQVIDGRGQIIGVTAEAGMGKSRLVAEVIRLGQRRHMAVLGGECQSYGTNTSYLVWQTIWRSFFGLDIGQSYEQQLALVEQNLADIDPALLPRLPLLGAVLNLDIPDTDLTRTFDAKLRKASLESLLSDCLRVRSLHVPQLIILEDCHWIDPLSHDLLGVLGRAIANLSVLLVVAYRPLQLPAMADLPVRQLTFFHEISLTSLPAVAVGELVQGKIAQLYGDSTQIAAEVVEQITARTEGNPFYIEELLNYLHDRAVDLQRADVIGTIDLPTSLHSLILSRIDQLREDQRTLIRIASVIGRIFQAAILWGISNFFGTQERLRQELRVLSDLEITSLDSPEPELSYLFKHIVIQEVAYESLPYATRATIHEQIGQILEQASDSTDRYVNLLAYHYDRSQNEAKRREYLLRAGDAARADYANAAAIYYYQRVLELLPTAEQVAVLMNLGQVLELLGRWSEADLRYQAALALAERVGQPVAAAQAQAQIGELLRKQGQYPQAQPWLEAALRTLQTIDDPIGLAQVLHFQGSLAMHQGQYDLAVQHYQASLALRRAQNDAQMIGSLLSNLGIIAFHQGDVPQAWALSHEALAIRRTTGNKLWIANSLGNLGMLALEEGNLAAARRFMEEALRLERDVGDRSAVAISLNNLGSVARELGEYRQAFDLYRESLIITRDLGDSWALCYLLEDIGCLAALQNDPEKALLLVAAATTLREQINAPLSPPEQTSLDRKLEPARQALGTAAKSVWQRGRNQPLDAVIASALAEA
ncbi:MAG: adenylate/guanylate cyclase domain-containing protein [Roseiflexaceae bacterium]